MSANEKDLIPAELQRDIDLTREDAAAAVEKLRDFADAECGKAIQ